MWRALAEAAPVPHHGWLEAQPAGPPRVDTNGEYVRYAEETSIAAVAARLDRLAVMRGVSLHGGPDPDQGLVSPSRASPPHYTAAPSPAATPRDVTAFDARLELVQGYAQRLESPGGAGAAAVASGTPAARDLGPSGLVSPGYPGGSGASTSGGGRVDWGGAGRSNAPLPPPWGASVGLRSSTTAGVGGVGVGAWAGVVGAGAGEVAGGSGEWAAASPPPPQPQPQPHPQQPAEMSPAARQRALTARLAVARAKSPSPLSTWPSSPRCIPHPDPGGASVASQRRLSAAVSVEARSPSGPLRRGSTATAVGTGAEGGGVGGDDAGMVTGVVDGGTFEAEPRAQTTATDAAASVRDFVPAPYSNDRSLVKRSLSPCGRRAKVLREKAAQEKAGLAKPVGGKDRGRAAWGSRPAKGAATKATAVRRSRSGRRKSSAGQTSDGSGSGAPLESLLLLPVTVVDGDGALVWQGGVPAGVPVVRTPTGVVAVSALERGSEGGSVSGSSQASRRHGAQWPSSSNGMPRRGRSSSRSRRGGSKSRSRSRSGSVTGSSVGAGSKVDWPGDILTSTRPHVTPPRMKLELVKSPRGAKGSGGGGGSGGPTRSLKSSGIAWGKGGGPSSPGPLEPPGVFTAPLSHELGRFWGQLRD